jgi:Tfp pilus assembly protein PilF
MKRLLPVCTLIAGALLAGCAVAPVEETPLPVSENSAVLALVDSARNDNAAGKPDSASATLERALRIEPRNPVLWHELAQIRLQQGSPDQAASLAAKSNAWAGRNRALQAANWRIISRARSLRGDFSGAQQAFDTAIRLESR